MSDCIRRLVISYHSLRMEDRDNQANITTQIEFMVDEPPMVIYGRNIIMRTEKG